MLQYNSRNKIDNDGFKYAITRINNKCDGLSIELCNLYLSLNKIRKLLDNNCVPDYYLSIGMNQ